jgi:competence ComEA-like helix-hairpin-helix protein
MQTSNLPINFAVLFFFFLCGSALISSCTSRKVTPIFRQPTSTPSASFVININKASESDLEKLPHVGPALAKKIIEHRETYGPFRRPEHLLAIDGLSEKRFLEFRRFINTE